jgi:hypothetical protein
VSPYHEDESVSKQDVEEWLRKASLNKFNIFNNYNKIILRLCKTLLKEWNSDDN